MVPEFTNNQTGIDCMVLLNCTGSIRIVYNCGYWLRYPAGCFSENEKELTLWDSFCALSRGT